MSNEIQNFFEPRFGRDFSDVRIHADSNANQLASSINAKAFTKGKDIIFGSGMFLPENSSGKRLLGHELTHVVQQENKPRWKKDQANSFKQIVFSLNPKLQIGHVESDNRIIQRDVPQPGPSMVTTPLRQPFSAGLTPSHRTLTDPDIGLGVTGSTGSLSFSRIGEAHVRRVFILGPVNDPHLRDMRAYIQNTIGVPEVEVTSAGGIEEIFRDLTSLESSQLRVARLIIVSHGTPGEESAAGSQAGQVLGQHGWITPQDVMTFALTSPLAQQVRENVMANDAIVEFWGCHIGTDIGARAAWSTAFGQEFRAPIARQETGGYRYYRRVNSGTRGAQRVPGRRGWWLRVTNTSDVPPSGQQHFRDRLLNWYSELLASQEIIETNPPRNEDQQFEYMRHLFDRSQGTIRFIQIREGSHTFRPGQEGWLRLWNTEPFNPTRLMDMGDELD